MKLYRSELATGLDNTLFEIPVDKVNIGDLRFASDKILCHLSSKEAADGYKISGQMEFSTIATCDRCLTEFVQQHDANLEIYLTGDQDMESDPLADFIYFPAHQDWIELSSILVEFIYLDQTIKTLCSPGCKGLCDTCGQNLNQGDCSCQQDSTDERWDGIKKLLN